MKNRFLVPAVVFALCLPALHADIGENFAKGGIGLSGSVSFFNNFYYFADSADERNFWSLGVSPAVDYYVANRVSLTMSPWFYYESFTDGPEDYDRALSFGMSVGGDYAFVRNHSAQKGVVFALGATLGVGFYPGVDDLEAGVEIPDNSRQTELRLALTPRVFFFVNDRVAPYIGLRPQLGYLLLYRDSSGVEIDLTSGERLYARLWATLGIALFVPSKKASLFLSH